MKNFSRSNTLFSLCGLNCGLCIMHFDNYCPGCGGGAGNQPCAIARCSIEHGGTEYCFLCHEYPCNKYNNIDMYDSFIVHRNQLKDLEKAKHLGINTYQSELEEKMKILNYLVENYNDGRRKSFFCLAVNLLELQDINIVVKQIESKTKSSNQTMKEKATIAAELFKEMALNRNILLKLNKKASSK